MQLIQILLIVTAALVLLSGLSVVFGSPKEEKAGAVKFFLATLGAALWTLAILVALMPAEDAETMVMAVPFISVAVIGSIMLCDVSLLAYLSHKRKYGGLATGIFALVGLALIAVIVVDPAVFCHVVVENETSAYVELEKSWYYFALIAYFCLITLTFSGFLLRRIDSAERRGLKSGLKVFYAGLTIGGVLALIFDLLIMTAHPELTWIGPMACSISILSFYYSVVRFRIIKLSSGWMRAMSFFILVTTGIILYALVFYIVFVLLFRTSNPSSAVLLLNVIMAVVLLLAVPAIREVVTFMRSLMNVDRVDLGYIMKKLEAIQVKQDFEPREVAGFLADSMHYDYVVLIVNGVPHYSSSLKFTAPEVEKLHKMHHESHKEWYLADEIDGQMVDKYKISRVGVLRDQRGHEMGKIVFGEHQSDVKLSYREEAKHDAVVKNLAACIAEINKS